MGVCIDMCLDTWLDMRTKDVWLDMDLGIVALGIVSIIHRHQLGRHTWTL